MLFCVEKMVLDSFYVKFKNPKSSTLPWRVVLDSDVVKICFVNVRTTSKYRKKSLAIESLVRVP